MAKKRARRKAGTKAKRPIEQYAHQDQQRPNNPPVGLVTPDTDPTELPKQTYAYDPHLDPELRFDRQGAIADAYDDDVNSALAAICEAEQLLLDAVSDDSPLDADRIAALRSQLEGARESLARLQKLREPYLTWAGKAERTSFEVPTVSLHVHERIDPKSIIRAARSNGDSRTEPGTGPKVQRSLFEQPKENPPLRDALDFYKHPHGWTNRLIAGDSLLVMNSLLEKEGMAGKVQMIYIDPPYGIRYGSNFQPFVNRRDVKDGRDEDLTQEPEMIKAFRDTWELGIHSYLTYLRDRLLLARELLHESGSVFVQIGNENLHIVRAILDETFGRGNYLTTISFVTTTGTTGAHLPTVENYLVGYAKHRNNVKYRQLYLSKRQSAGAGPYSWIEESEGTRRRMTRSERTGETPLPPGSRVFRLDNLQSQSGGRAKGEGAACWFAVEYAGQTFKPSLQSTWKTNEDGMKRLHSANRFQPTSSALYYVRFLDDFPVQPLSNAWGDTVTAGFASEKRYVVETNQKVVERCVLMTTDPGDIVLDPTCGSGTTAYVAEQWGRRWITCDTSRVAVTLAKQRLMTAVYDYYRLAHPAEGVRSGFVYRTVPHITLKSIANNPEIREGMTREEIDAAIAKYADQEVLYDQPEVDRSKARVTGPFTVEAVPAINVRPVEEATEPRPLTLEEQQRLPGIPDPDPQQKLTLTAEVSVARYGETSRQAEWRDELARTGVRGKGGRIIRFARMEPLPATRHLHAIGETIEGDSVGPKTVVVSFGPEHAPLEQRQVEQAWEEARSLKVKPDILLFAAFHFDPEAAKDIDELTPEKTGMQFLKLQMNTDLLTDDLKKKRSSNQSFWLIGQPDVELRPVKKGEQKGQWQVEVRGFDYYNPANGEIESGDTSKIAMWMLDPDYDGRSLYPRQVFFPMAGAKDGWAKLAKSLKAEIDPDRIEAYRGTESLPFVAGGHGRVAVKIIDDRGIESLKVMSIEG
ncbi:Modification methylase BamHI [Maioricimonas rarisocia]|uniref:site-specific DNA-methyltransferase (adenine-specific) n=1 Tax=Maioricimonas rarisocia TaxID=2528026 RepID=A0A517Z9N3_9PLAN|nr:site-specific DNA-methyltransferase [Maioricimonas rarisocia]QDU39198.1 Modification methylase BamHI [Maioricimonas rarisocia]